MVEASSRDVEWQSNRVKYVHHKKNGVGTGVWRRAARARGTEGHRQPLQDALWKPGKLYVGKHGTGMLECHLQTRGSRPCLPVGSKDGDGETAKDGPLR